MDPHPDGRPSQLFELRMWLECLGDGQTEWRGQLKHVLSSQVRYFRDWPTLVKHLLTMSSIRDESPAGSGRETVDGIAR